MTIPHMIDWYIPRDSLAAYAEQPANLPNRCTECKGFLRRLWECEEDQDEDSKFLVWYVRCKRCGHMNHVNG